MNRIENYQIKITNLCDIYRGKETFKNPFLKLHVMRYANESLNMKELINNIVCLAI